MLNTKILLSFFLISLAMACVNKRKDTDTPVPTPVHSYPQLRTGSQVSMEIFTTSTNRQDTFLIRKFPSGPPSPLIIAFHGGGFVNGHRNDMIPAVLNTTQGYSVLTEQQLDAAGIAYITFGYTKLNPYTNIGLHNPLNECLEFVTHIRNNASSYNIDPNKIVLMGFSAGASASLWIGLQNPSLNIKGIVTLSPQATLNLLEWRSQVFAPFNQLSTYDGWVAQSILSNPATYSLYYSGATNSIAVNSYSNLGRLNFLNLIDSNDPELYLSASGVVNDLLHQSCHVYALQKKAQEKNLRSKIHYTRHPFYTHPNTESVIAFCVRKFNE